MPASLLWSLPEPENFAIHDAKILVWKAMDKLPLSLGF